MGTRDRDYLNLARYLDRYTGGFGLAVQARSRFDGENVSVPMVTIGGKCLDRNTERLFAVLDDILEEIRFTDLDQLRRVMLEFRALQEGAVVHNGHRLAISLANRGLTLSAYLNELWQGVHQLQTIKSLTAALESNGAELDQTAHRLARMARALFRRGNLDVALIGTGEALAEAAPRALALLDRLPDGPAHAGEHPLAPPIMATVREGWHTGTAVSFVARTLPCVRYAHPDAPALAVAAKLLRSLYLHREIREKGGAYGGFAIYNPEEGLFSYGSYRDPHIVRTLEVFGAAGNFMSDGTYDAEDIHEAILQVCSEIDRPDPPGPAARKAFYRKLVGLEDDVRQQFKARLLTLTPEAVKVVAQRYLACSEDQAATAVISSRAQLEAANQTLVEKPLTLHAI
jgi:Zn-dependent M16 (insulinase) family peptidase